MELIKESACVCFTATPDNKDPSGLEAKLVKTFGITKFNYMVGGENEDEDNQKKFLALDIQRNIEKESATSLELKISFILKKNKEGPVLVFCSEDLLKAMTEKNMKLICVEPNQVVDSEFLRNLDRSNEEGLFSLVVSTNTFGMRGIDYRSQGVPMHLILAKSFDTERDAL